MSTTKHEMSVPAASPNCLDIHPFTRMKYFFGQMLSADDFSLEQRFFQEKLKLHNRCLHGYGTVCGLVVNPLPIPKSCTAAEEEEERKLLEELQNLLKQESQATPTPAPAASASSPGPAPGVQTAGQPSATQPAPSPPPENLGAKIEEIRRLLGDHYEKHCKEEPRTRVTIECGVALDCEGNELVLRKPATIDLLQWLSAADFKRVQQGADTLYLSICYCEQPTSPTKPVLPDLCGAVPDCMYGRITESVKISVTVDPPAEDTRCETCCEPCAEPCLLLAKIDHFHPGCPLSPDDILNDVRRRVGVAYPSTTITGISWKNGHYYSQTEARELMGTFEHGEYRGRGLEIRFSRPVRASAIHPGVMDTWVVEGGRGRSGNIYNKSGEFVDKPKGGLIDRLFYRDTSRETLEPGDRVLVILRTEFILDECCRPVNGVNVGGRIPILEEYVKKFHFHPNHEECHVPPGGYGPWHSGLGVPCGGFESWFFIREDEIRHSRP